jgi:hypothetical protein
MRHLKPWERTYYSLRARLNVPVLDLKYSTELSLFKKINMWGKGFLSDKYYYYGLDKNSYREYLSDYQRALARFINHPFTEVLNNKLIFDHVLCGHANVPKVYATILDGKIHLSEGSKPADYDGYTDKASLISAICRENKKIVLKPIKGAFGIGIYIIFYQSDGSYLVNLQELSGPELQKKLQGLNNYLITEFIEQGEQAGKYFPVATNTLRILTMADPVGGTPFIAAAVRRVGTKKSAPLDNAAQGGLTVDINIDTGELGLAAQLTPRGLIWYDSHPDTGVRITGDVIPGWSSIKDKVLTLVAKLPYLKYVGWDIIDTDKDLVYLEGNNQSSVRVWQIHKPLLKDPRIKEFYRYHKIIR